MADRKKRDIAQVASEVKKKVEGPEVSSLSLSQQIKIWLKRLI